jgi:hypothetical protein
VSLRSHGSLSLDRALMAAGLVDFVQVTLFPVITIHKSSPTGPPCMPEPMDVSHPPRAGQPNLTRTASVASAAATRTQHHSPAPLSVR